MRPMDSETEIEKQLWRDKEIREDGGGGGGVVGRKKGLLFLQTQSRHHAKHSLRMLAEDSLEEKQGFDGIPDAAVCT